MAIGNMVPTRTVKSLVWNFGNCIGLAIVHKIRNSIRHSLDRLFCCLGGRMNCGKAGMSCISGFCNWMGGKVFLVLFLFFFCLHKERTKESARCRKCSACAARPAHRERVIIIWRGITIARLGCRALMGYCRRLIAPLKLLSVHSSKRRNKALEDFFRPKII